MGKTAQKLAVVFAVVGFVILTVSVGGLPWVTIGVAASRLASPSSLGLSS